MRKKGTDWPWEENPGRPGSPGSPAWDTEKEEVSYTKLHCTSTTSPGSLLTCESSWTSFTCEHGSRGALLAFYWLWFPTISQPTLQNTLMAFNLQGRVGKGSRSHFFLPGESWAKFNRDTSLHWLTNSTWYLKKDCSPLIPPLMANLTWHKVGIWREQLPWNQQYRLTNFFENNFFFFYGSRQESYLVIILIATERQKSFCLQVLPSFFSVCVAVTHPVSW